MTAQKQRAADGAVHLTKHSDTILSKGRTNARSPYKAKERFVRHKYELQVSSVN